MGVLTDSNDWEAVILCATMAEMHAGQFVSDQA